MNLFNNRKKLTLLAACISAAAWTMGAGPVWAVHDDSPVPLQFELDGDATDYPVGLPDDWNTVLLGGGSSNVTTGLVVDPTGADETTHFKGGDKDTQDIPEWDIVTQNDTPKDDIEHAFAAAYTNGDGDLVIYAGDDRFAQAGDASHGFWFFKNPVGINGNKFSGVHADGDVFVAVEFKQGNPDKGVIAVFRWESTPVGNNPNLQEIFRNEQAIVPGVPFCNSAGGGFPADVVCGISNTDPKDAPWDYLSSAGDTDFPSQAFFELGINITKFTGETCFASFLASSRSSSTSTATIKDFSLHTFPLCGVEVGKACVGSPTTPDGTTLRTTFNVPVTSTGSGTIHQVKLAEVPNPALGTGESCKITAIGTPTGAVSAIPVASLPVTFSNTTPVTVYTSLPGNTTANVTIVCDTVDRNPFINKVAVTAKSAASLTTPDLSSDHTTGIDENGDPVAGETCAFSGNADVIAKKCCKTVTIDPDTFAPKVCVSIQLQNNSNPPEALENITVVDNVLGTVLSSGTLTASGAGSILKLTGDALCYTATSADQTGDPVDADNITFSDQLTTVSGTGSLSGDTFSLTGAALPSATCNLCGNQPGCDFTP